MPSQNQFANLWNQVRFNDQGLIAAIAQEATTGQILMLAWMNREALALTLKTRRVTYYSRSRQALWRKGESSGQTQSLVSTALDCDGDAVLLQVNQTGVACHTGRKSCFYQAIDPKSGDLSPLSEPEVSPSQLYREKSS